MLSCEKCGLELNDNIKFCPKCGTKLQEDINLETEKRIKLNEQKKKEKALKGVVLATILLVVLSVGYSIYFKKTLSEAQYYFELGNYSNADSKLDSLFVFGSNKTYDQLESLTRTGILLELKETSISIDKIDGTFNYDEELNSLLNLYKPIKMSLSITNDSAEKALINVLKEDFLDVFEEVFGLSEYHVNTKIGY